MTAPTIRPYRPADRDAVRKICCDTAFHGEPIETIFPDREFMADALMNYYTDHETESLFVAELDGRVVGYCAGCVDTRRFVRVWAARVLPRVLWLFLAHGHVVRPKSWRVLSAWVGMGRRQSADRPRIIEQYPAHCHVNVQPGRQRSGIGAHLLNALLDQLKRRGVAGVHISTMSEQGKAFFGKAGMQRLARYPGPKLPGHSATEVWFMGMKLGS